MSDTLNGGSLGNNLTSLYLTNPNLAGALRRQQLAQALSQEGTSTAPASPYQALARVAQSALGAALTNTTNGQISDAADKMNADRQAWFGGGQPSPLAGAMTGPPPQAPQAAAAPPTGYAATVAQGESGGNPQAKNPRSSATGPSQEIDSTWQSYMQANPAKFQGMTPEQGMAARTDPAMATDFTNWYAGQNAPILQKAGVDPTPANLAIAHRFGPGDAVRVLTAPDNAPVSAALSMGGPQHAQQVLAANPDLANATTGSIKAKYGQQFAQSGAGSVMQGSGGQQPASFTGQANAQPSDLTGQVNNGQPDPMAAYNYHMRRAQLAASSPDPLIRGQAQIEEQLASRYLQIGQYHEETRGGLTGQTGLDGKFTPYTTAAGRAFTDGHGNSFMLPPGGGAPVPVGTPNSTGLNPGNERTAAEIQAIPPAQRTPAQQNALDLATTELSHPGNVSVAPGGSVSVGVPSVALPSQFTAPGARGGPPGAPAPIPTTGGAAAGSPSPAPAGAAQGGGQSITSAYPPEPIMAQRQKDFEGLSTASDAAQKELYSAQLLKQTFKDLGSTGPATPYLANLSRYLVQAGLPQSLLNGLNLPNGATEAQASAIANELAMRIAKENFPGRVTNVDVALAKSTKPSTGMPDEAANFLLDNAVIPAAQRDIDRYKAVVDLPGNDPALASLRPSLAKFDADHPLQSYSPYLKQKAAGASAAASTPRGIPQVGDVQKGHRFLGGDPSKQSSWQAVQ